jgi:hypothetical protein
MVLTYFLNDFQMVPAAPIITGITLVFTFHIIIIFIIMWDSSAGVVTRLRSGQPMSRGLFYQYQIFVYSRLPPDADGR